MSTFSAILALLLGLGLGFVIWKWRSMRKPDCFRSPRPSDVPMVIMAWAGKVVITFVVAYLLLSILFGVLLALSGTLDLREVPWLYRTLEICVYLLIIVVSLVGCALVADSGMTEKERARRQAEDAALARANDYAREERRKEELHHREMEELHERVERLYHPERAYERRKAQKERWLRGLWQRYEDRYLD